MREIANEDGIMKRLSVNQIPLFLEEELAPLQVDMDNVAIAGNLCALFQIGFVHYFCVRGVVDYGYNSL